MRLRRRQRCKAQAPLCDRLGSHSRCITAQRRMAALSRSLGNSSHQQSRTGCIIISALQMAKRMTQTAARRSALSSASMALQSLRTAALATQKRTAPTLRCRTMRSHLIGTAQSIVVCSVTPQSGYVHAVQGRGFRCILTVWAP